MKAYTLLAALMLAVPVMAQQAGGSAPHAKAQSGLELLTDPEGVDFNSTLRALYLAVKNRWYANMPPSVEKGNQGVNAVEFRVLQDGSVPNKFLKMAYRSRKSDLDAASLQAIRGAAPFSHLPEKFSKPFIVLRVTFYYNIEPPKR